MNKVFLELRISKNINNSPIPIIFNVNAMSNFHPITANNQWKRVCVLHGQELFSAFFEAESFENADFWSLHMSFL